MRLRFRVGAHHSPVSLEGNPLVAEWWLEGDNIMTSQKIQVINIAVDVAMIGEHHRG
jgi:hypothetical protein